MNNVSESLPRDNSCPSLHSAPALWSRTARSVEFTDWEKERIVGTRDIVEETKKAFQRDEWFGAFARLHCMVEFWMQEIYEFDSKKDQKIGHRSWLWR